MDELLPPWKKYPKIKKYSIGWRMGEGESYLIEWRVWYAKQSEEYKKEYKEKYPSPILWFRFYKSNPSK